MKLSAIVCLTFLTCPLLVSAADSDHSAGANHSQHNSHQQMEMAKVALTEAGSDAFGTIQEVINQLLNDPTTDWGTVNIEALRQHLVDMHDMTLNVDVISQKPIPNGLEAIISATTDRAASALKRVLKAHPAQLKRETGWEMRVTKNNKQYILTTTSANPKDTNKIRGLGYIGLMAYGSHHQPHHWAMATGKNPHDSHH